jgi:hypothetical protein
LTARSPTFYPADAVSVPPAALASASHARRWTGATLVWLLPVALIVHAVTFWGPGLADREGQSFILNYLADRPMDAAVFDPALNDWGTYQARELSYLVDYLDAQVFAALFDRDVLLLIPASGVLGLLAIIALYLRGSRTLWRLDRVTTALLLSWFLSTIVVQASTAIYYRSAKVLTALFMLALVYQVVKLVQASGSGLPASGVGLRAPGVGLALTGMAVTGVALSVSDRQGFFFLALLLGLFVLWMIASPGGDRLPLPTALRIGRALGVALLGGAFYNYLAGPWLIHWLNDYWPNFSYQEIDAPGGLTSARLWREAWVMVHRQAEFLTGGFPVWAATLFALAVYVRRVADLPQSLPARVHTVIRDAALSAAALVGLLAMTALMILRHRFIYTIPDHSYWYYFLPAHVLFLAGVSMALARLDGLTGWWRYAAWTVITLMIAGNARLYPAQRTVMVNSDWLKWQVARADVINRGWKGLREGRVPDDIPRWVSVESAGARLRLPVPNNHLFPDTVRAALATRSRIPPLDQAPGTQWGELRDFLMGSASPLLQLHEWPDVLDGLRSMGVREIQIDPARYDDRAFGDQTVAAIRAASGHVIGESVVDGAVLFTLAEAPAAFREPGRVSRLSPADFSLAASHAADRVPQLIDGDIDSRWLTGVRQQGGEWLRVTFDRPRDLARLRLDLERRSWGDYPRGLRIESHFAGKQTILYEGTGIGPLLGSVLRRFLAPAVEIDFPANTTEVLLIHQTGETAVWFWSAHELAIWERPIGN